MKSYIVYKEYGEYEYYRFIIVSVCKTLEKAQEICERRELEVKAKIKSQSRCNNCKFADAKVSQLERAKRLPKCYKAGRYNKEMPSIGPSCCVGSNYNTYIFPATQECANANFDYLDEEDTALYEIKEYEMEE